MYLIFTISSHFNPGTIYAPAGTKVTVVAIHGDVFIVRDCNGERFPVHRNLVSDEKTEITEVSGVVEANNYKQSNRGRITQKKAPPIVQQNLF